jgi:drug/metabolite transporter (DMT)-like permease
VSGRPLFVGLASHLLLREPLSRGMIVALVTAIAGSVLIGLGDLGAGTHQLWGDVLALVGAIAAAGYFLIGRRLRVRLSLLAYVFPVYGTAALVLMAGCVTSRQPTSPSPRWQSRSAPHCWPGGCWENNRRPGLWPVER